MTQSDIVELIAACEAALLTAERGMGMAKALAEGCRSGLRPPDEVIHAYLARVQEDDDRLARLRARIAEWKISARS
jgi:hypothetical protein